MRLFERVYPGSRGAEALPMGWRRQGRPDVVLSVTGRLTSAGDRAQMSVRSAFVISRVGPPCVDVPVAQMAERVVRYGVEGSTPCSLGGGVFDGDPPCWLSG